MSLHSWKNILYISINQLTPRSIVLLEKLIIRSARQEIPRLLWNPKVNCCSQEPANGPYPEPDESNPHPALFP
jgi:hypothetical protein